MTGVLCSMGKNSGKRLLEAARSAEGCKRLRKEGPRKEREKVRAREGGWEADTRTTSLSGEEATRGSQAFRAATAMAKNSRRSHRGSSTVKAGRLTITLSSDGGWHTTKTLTVLLLSDTDE